MTQDAEPDYAEHEFAPAPATDETAATAARHREDLLTKPTGSLGRLEELAVWAAAVQGVCPPHRFTRPRVVVFAGDHGIARSGVSKYPIEVTAQMVANFLAGGAGVNALARAAGAGVRVADLSVAVDIPDAPAEVTRHKVRVGSGSIDREDAMSYDEAVRAVVAGRAIADEEIDAGADLLVPGDMGIGNTTAAAVLTALLAGAEPHTVVGRGTGIDDEAWMRKAAAVRDAVRRGRPHLADPIALLAAVGGADFAAMSGFLAQAAQRRTPVVLDGIISGATALVAEKLSPGSRAWWVAGHRSTEPAQAAAFAALDLVPIVDLGMRLGEGTGALVAIPILQAAIATLAEMATFDEAGVSDA